jgi:hypothetical protein
MLLLRKNILIQGVECRDYLSVPLLHSMNLESELYSGLAVIGVRPVSRVRGGNDLVGGKVKGYS